MTVATVYCPVKELYDILGRALNTLDPQKAPQWAVELHDKLYDRIEPVTLIFELRKCAESSSP